MLGKLGADEAGPVAHTVADDKERRAGVGAREQRENARGVPAGPVVEGERDVPDALAAAVHGETSLGERRQGASARVVSKRHVRLRSARKRERERDGADERVSHASVTSAIVTSERAASRRSVATEKTACGVPAAHQRRPNRRSDSSTTVGSGRSWPRGGTPPMANPVASRTSSARAERTPSPSFPTSTRRSPAQRQTSGPAGPVKTSDLTI